MDGPRPPQRRSSRWADALSLVALILVALLVLGAFVYGVSMVWGQISRDTGTQQSQRLR